MLNWEEWIKNKRVSIFVAETVPSYSGGGLNAFNFAKYLSQKAESVTILCYNYNKKQEGTETIDKVNIRRVNYYNRNFFSKLLSLPVLAISYFSMTRKNNIGIIYGRYLIGYELILVFSYFLRKDIIFRSTLLGDDDMESICKRSRMLWPLRKFLFSKITCYYSINTALSQKWGKYFSSTEKIFQSSQGIDLQKFHPQITRNQNIRKQLYIPNNCKIFFSCGFLIERKGYRDIFDSLAKIKFPFVYIIAGQHTEDPAHRSSPAELEEMKSLYAYGKHVLKDRIRFIGNTSMVEDYYIIADIFIHGASDETPNVLFEAMACGIPSLIKKMPGLSYPIIRKNVIEFEHYNEIPFLIESLILDPERIKKITRNAIDTVSEYSFENVAGNLFKRIYGQ